MRSKGFALPRAPRPSQWHETFDSTTAFCQGSQLRVRARERLTLDPLLLREDDPTSGVFAVTAGIRGGGSRLGQSITIFRQPVLKVFGKRYFWFAVRFHPRFGLLAGTSSVHVGR